MYYLIHTFRSQVGVPRSLPTEWYDNQKWKQLPFYMKDLPRARHTHLKERLKEFAVAFDHWDYLNNTDLGKRDLIRVVLSYLNIFSCCTFCT